ncbi:MAG TPA: hypothetical protein VI958_01270, partial [Acidobacteriota bacterium]
LSLRILESVKRELDSMEVPFQSYRNLESSVVDALSPFLSVSTLCGTHLVCTDGIGAEPLPETDDRIYLLSLPHGLEELIEMVANKALDSVLLSLGIETAEALKRRVKAGIFQSLMPYIFHNPFCGNHEICRHSQPLNPWN